MKTAAVSPHLDDAALSASAGLAAGDVTVATVFTALPPGGMPVSWWDRFTGAGSSAERQRERLAEDHAAMRLLAAHGVHLGEPEALYRDGDPDLSGTVGGLTELFEVSDEVWLPAGIGGHPDHALARQAGLRAAAAAGHREVVLYADYPYVIRYGWPGWVTGEPADPYLDPGFWLTHQLESAGIDPGSLIPAVRRLDPGQRTAKAQIIGAYRSQARALGLAPADLARDPAKLDYELSWRMPLRPEAP